MKNLTILFLIFLAFTTGKLNAQSKTNVIKTDVLKSTSGEVQKDSSQLKQEQVNAFIEQVVKKTPVTEFQQWCYKKMTAEKYDEFTKLYQVFLQQKYDEWVKQKNK